MSIFNIIIIIISYYITVYYRLSYEGENTTVKPLHKGHLGDTWK